MRSGFSYTDYDNHRGSLSCYHTTNLLSLLRIPHLFAAWSPSCLNVFCVI